MSRKHDFYAWYSQTPHKPVRWGNAPSSWDMHPLCMHNSCGARLRSFTAKPERWKAWAERMRRGAERFRGTLSPQ